jgi:hypothetical protein
VEIVGVSKLVEDHNCLCALVVVTPLYLSKLSLSLQSETSEHVSTYNTLQNIFTQSHDCN